MNEIEQAYAALGLTTDAGANDIEKRYRQLVRRIRALEQRGAVTLRDEAEMLAANRAYRFIVEEELKRRSEDYRNKRYGKYRRFSGFAESIDHFWDYHKPHIFGGLFLCLLLFTGAAFLKGVIQHHAASVNTPIPDLSLVIVEDSKPVNEKLRLSTEHKLLRLLPEWKHIDTKIMHDPLAVVTENPDLYIVDRESFIKLARLGFLGKLEQWDAYGIDLSGGPLKDVISFSKRPMIAAVNAEAAHPDNALRFIRQFLEEDTDRLKLTNVSK